MPLTGCSFVADLFDGAGPHLNGHDVTLVAESIAPLEELNATAGALASRGRLRARHQAVLSACDAGSGSGTGSAANAVSRVWRSTRDPISSPG